MVASQDIGESVKSYRSQNLVGRLKSWRFLALSFVRGVTWGLLKRGGDGVSLPTPVALTPLAESSARSSATTSIPSISSFHLLLPVILLASS